MAETECDTVIHSGLPQLHVASGHHAGRFKPEALSHLAHTVFGAAFASASMFLLPASESDGCLGLTSHMHMVFATVQS